LTRSIIEEEKGFDDLAVDDGGVLLNRDSAEKSEGFNSCLSPAPEKQNFS